MKKIILAMIAAVIAITSFVGCGKESDYPKIAYIEDVLYYGTNTICEAVPRKMPDGVIETFVPEEIMPDAYNSANFGSKQGQIEFMTLEDGQMILHLGENWVYFEKAE